MMLLRESEGASSSTLCDNNKPGAEQRPHLLVNSVQFHQGGLLRINHLALLIARDQIQLQLTAEKKINFEAPLVPYRLPQSILCVTCAFRTARRSYRVSGSNTQLLMLLPLTKCQAKFAVSIQLAAPERYSDDRIMPAPCSASNESELQRSHRAIQTRSIYRIHSS
jgi:hypothetical protein